jgi:hypothetical protein
MNESSANSSWYVRFPDKESGPFTFDQLRKLGRSGRLTPQHLISDDRKQWSEAGRQAALEFDADGHSEDGQAISITCSCGQSFRTPRVYVGTERTCPQCGGKLKVPEPPPRAALASVADTGSSDAERTDRTTLPDDPRFAIRPWHERLPRLFYVAVNSALAASIVETLITWAMAVALGAGVWTILLLLPSLLPISRSLVLFAIRSGAGWSWYGIHLLALADIAISCYFVLVSGFLFPAAIAIVIYMVLLPVLYLPDVRRFLS